MLPTRAGPRAWRPSGGESSIGTARCPLLPGLDRRPVLRAPGAGLEGLCRPRRLRGGRRLQGNGLGREAGPSRAAQGDGARPGPADRRGAGDRAVALGPQHAGSAAHPAGPGGAPGLGAGDERPGLRSLNAARAHDGDDHRRPCDVRARTDPRAYPLRHCRCEGPWQTSWPPTRTAAEVRSPRAEGPRPGRPKAQLPPDRSRTWAEQEHRRRHRQTAPLRRRPRALTALMFQLCPLGVNLCPFYRVTPARLVFIDETGASTNMARLRGRAPKGERRRAGIPRGHWKTTTFVAGLRLTGMV